MTSELTRDQAGPTGVSVRLGAVVKEFETETGELIRALDGLSLDVAAGEFIAIVGPSGCGKSTLLNILAGLDRASTGLVEIGGAPARGPHPEAGVVFQSDYLLPWRSVLDNVLLPIEIKGLDRKAHVPAAEQLLADVGLAGFGAKKPSELSGGMRQRAGICRAIIQKPGLLLMDEPFGALDALTREQMIIDLQALWLRLGNTVIFITHGIDEAVFLADRVIVLSPRPGRIDLDLKVDMARPRQWAEAHADPEFQRCIGEVRRCFERRGVLHRAQG
ncbi:ABC transporter ATP-binding protein [Pseudooceanicola sp. CBS1P-1]|uniref:ATP-binding cassette domain-containing protein n=1 Tax=Pseudooceanicola albus TaxID=2692189 RepID=A0A6L7G570_9RHOB|nr:MULTISPECIES: ABC transporter ATP-binding protein [Pseudooceanicola]MBT9385229.1 ABC transporter ATP-binding protein [Pseudooceanicola endophyticus]MXN18687.1 ATP-binding cassette domain-containing protein [Pseudooceanicola albus]